MQIVFEDCEIVRIKKYFVINCVVSPQKYDEKFTQIMCMDFYVILQLQSVINKQIILALLYF